MRKYTKFLAMILALVLMLQVAPLAAFGDASMEGDSKDPANTLTDGETSGGDEPTETDPEPEGTPIEVNLIEWRLDGSNDDFKTLAQGGTIDINKILFRLTFSEKATSVAVKISGVDVQVTKVLNFAFFNLEVINGNHEMEITVTNAYGTTVETVKFSVGGPVSYPTFDLETPADLLRGETADLSVKGQNLENLESLTLTLDIDPAFDVEDVILADGISGMYMWYKGSLVIVAEVADAAAVTDGVLATVRVKTPADMESDTLDWSIRSCEAVMSEASGLGSTDRFIGGTDMTLPEIGVSYAYFIEASEIAYKGVSYALRVRHYDGTYAADMGVYALINGEHVLVGKTDADGCLVTTYFDTYDSYSIYVMVGDDILSETVEIECLMPEGELDGTPYGLILGAPVAGGKTFSWMSGIIGSTADAILRLATAADMSDAINVIGTSQVAYFDGGKGLNRINSVSVSGLIEGATYYYQVGDGNVWSEVASFTVKAYGDSVSFAVFGNNAGSALIGAINNGAYDFAIQTGNLLADDASHDALASLLDNLGALEPDLIHALTASELKNSTINFLYGLDDLLYYSYEMGNVFVAVVNASADADELQAALDAMYTDAKVSTAAWKVLTIHTPAYTADDEAENELVAAYLPYYAERAGIDVVFSDADSYYRTDSLRDGVATEKNGVTYITVGSLNAENTIYVGVTATAGELVITAYSVDENGIATVIDTVTKTPYFCAEDEHDFRMNYEAGCLICDHCDTRESIATYVGPVWIGENLMFMSKGSFKSGWQVHMDKTYYIVPETMSAVDGEVEIGGYTYLFEDYGLKIGAWFERDGVMMLKWAGVTQRQTWITMDGKTYYFDQNGAYLTGVTLAPVVYDGVTVMEYHKFDENGVHHGRLADGLYVDDELIIYTVNGIAQHKGLVMDDEGNFYYIGSSREGIRSTTRYIDANWTNGLLPAGTYTFGIDGKMIDPPKAE